MGNIETTLNNANSVTIDISDITAEQRRLLSATIGYQAIIPDPNNEGQTINNPIPLIVALLMNSMNDRKEQVKNIIRQEALTAAGTTIAAQVDTL